MSYNTPEPMTVPQLKAAARRQVDEMARLVSISHERKLTPDERDAFDKADREARSIHGAIDARENYSPSSGDHVEGKPFEILKPGQSMAEWRSKAAANGVQGITNQGTDRDYNRYWAERCGLARPSIESRALGEDTSSGAGAGQAIVPQEWSASFIDLLRANLVLDKAGVSVMPMETELYNMPQFLADVAPVWLAENANNSLDANPQFGTLQFNATGAYQDVTLVSRQVLEDTNQQGGLDGLLRGVIAQKYARLVEQVAFYGTASNAGNPGLVNESGLVTTYAGTNGLAPVDTTPFSTAVEAVRNANAEPTAIITNPKVIGTFARLNASTYGKFWDLPRDVADLPMLYSTALASNETHGTGTNLSSFYAGDFSRMIIGMRVDLDVTVLKERYADIGQVGFWSYMRFSIRTSHPETFVRSAAWITT